jgi:uncharacterized protein YehS (DUF1456 family)
LRIDQQHAFRSSQHADRAALALKRVEIVRKLSRFDFDLAEVRALLGLDARGGEKDCGDRHVRWKAPGQHFGAP